MNDLFGAPLPVVRVIDFEATGLQPDAKVVEVGHCDFDVTNRAVGLPASYLCRVDHMPPDTRAVHHIRAEETAGLPPYDRWCLYEEAVRAGVVAFAAHTADFEQRFMLGSIPLVCTYKAALRVWPEAPSHSVFGLLYWLEDQGLAAYSRQLAMPPHRAGPDAYATCHLLAAIYAEGFEGRDLIKWTMEPRLLPRVPIGDWRGRRWDEPDWGFLRWIVNKRASGMDPDIVWNAEREIERREQAQ